MACEGAFVSWSAGWVAQKWWHSIPAGEIHYFLNIGGTSIEMYRDDSFHAWIGIAKNSFQAVEIHQPVRWLHVYQEWDCFAHLDRDNRSHGRV